MADLSADGHRIALSKHPQQLRGAYTDLDPAGVAWLISVIFRGSGIRYELQDALRKANRLRWLIIELVNSPGSENTYNRFFDATTFGEARKALMTARATSRIDRLLESLSVRDREVVDLRYGLNNGYGMSFANVSRKLGKHEKWAQQIHGYAMARLRHPSLAGHLGIPLPESGDHVEPEAPTEFLPP
jgi:hypothetical protein